MSPTVVLVWYLVVAGPQGGLAILPSYFDTREECVSAIIRISEAAGAARLVGAVCPKRLALCAMKESTRARRRRNRRNKLRQRRAIGRCASAVTDRSGFTLSVWNTTQ